MKTFGAILKVVAALAAIAGIIYIVAAYGDKMVAWAKKFLSRKSAEFECDYEDELEEEDFE